MNASRYRGQEKWWLLTAALLVLSCRGYSLPLCPGENISAHEAQVLGKYKIVRTEDGLLLDRSVVSDCTAKKAVEEIFDHGMGRGISDADRASMRRYSKGYNRALKLTWPLIAESGAVPSDGSNEAERWSLLDDQAVEDATLDKLLIPEVHRYGITEETAYLLMKRSTPRLNKLTETLVMRSDLDVSQTLMALVVLDSRNHNLVRERIDHLDCGGLGPEKRKVAGALKKKIDEGRSLNTSDLDAIVWD